jgi:predicted PurR-regulated permease PerM
MAFTMEKASTRLNARWLALVAATAIVLYLCWLMLEPFVDVLLWAAVLAMVAWPVQAHLRRRGYSASASAILTTLLVVLTVLVPLTLVTAAVVRQGAPAVDSLIDGVKRLLDPNSWIFQKLDQYLNLDLLRDPKLLASRLGAVGGAIATRSLGIVGGVLGGIVQVFFVLFTLYYLLRDSERVLSAIRAALPLSQEQADTIFRRTGEVIAASVNGVLVIAAAQGFLGMIAFLIVGLPSALLWGVVMFLLSTIPMAGSAIVWAPAAIYLAATHHWGKAIFLVVWGMAVIGTIDNVLRPRLVGKRAKLHELIIFFSVLGGLQVFGVLGLFVGPVVAAIGLALVEVFQRSNEIAERSERSESTIGQAPAVVVVAAAVSDSSPLPPPPSPLSGAPRIPDQEAPAGAPVPGRSGGSDR